MKPPLPPREKKPSIREIARLADVSHVTVSLALRHDPRITAATTKRVQAIARRIGYVPDPHLAELMERLRLGRSGTAPSAIGYLSFVHPQYGRKDSPTARRFFRGAQLRAKQLGYRLERFLLAPDALSGARVASILRARNIRGVLIAPLTEDVGDLALEWGRLAAVAFGHSLALPVHRVCNHHAHTMRLALRELSARGYQRCGVYLRDGINARVDDAWLATYYFHWHSLAPTTPAIPPLIGPAWDRAEFIRWFRRHRPDAVITIQLQVLDWLRETGAAVPGDVGFVHLDWSREMGEVAGIDQQSELVGAAALEQVAAHLSQHEYGLPSGPKTVLIEGIWREGSTARAQAPGPSSRA